LGFALGHSESDGELFFIELLRDLREQAPKGSITLPRLQAEGTDKGVA
jgi:hypothetical protein